MNGDEAKLSPQASTPVVATAPQAQPQQPVSTQLAPTIVSQPRLATADVAAAPAPEVSVADAARQARIAKAVREAKEKAERDNPPTLQ